MSHPVPTPPRPNLTLKITTHSRGCKTQFHPKDISGPCGTCFSPPALKPLVQCGNSNPAAARTGGAEKRRAAKPATQWTLLPGFKTYSTVSSTDRQSLSVTQRYLGRLQSPLSRSTLRKYSTRCKSQGKGRPTQTDAVSLNYCCCCCC